MSSTRLLILVLVAIILVAFASVASGDEVVERGAAQSVAFVFSRSIDGTSCGNGFLVGDGSLLITARNVVFPRRSSGLHQGETFVTVLSPHLGEAAEAQVVAHDRELELVLLRVPWRGHPALQIADESSLVAAEQLEVAAFTHGQSAVAGGRPALLASPPKAQRALLDINAVTVRRSATRMIVTSTAPPGPGWAGAPMLLPGSDAVAGCYVRTQADGSAGVGVACGPIARLIESAGVSAALARVDQRPAPPDANDAALAYLRGISASAAGEADRAVTHLRAFQRQRPLSAIGYRDLAGQFRALRRMDDAQAHYARALELEPALISARVLYGQLLHERMFRRAAEEHLTYAWRHGGGNTAAILPLCNLLREQDRAGECFPLLDEAVKRQPADGHLWNYLGQTKRGLADHAGAASAFARAADLMSDDPSARLRAAEQFEAAGLHAQAEFHYQALVAGHPNAATAHFHFARFIARESSRRDEAMSHAEQALKLADDPGAPPRSVIQSLIAAIRAGRTSPASEFRL